jgi:hypothetical protein
MLLWQADESAVKTLVYHNLSLSITCCFSLFDKRVQAVISSLVLRHPLQTPKKLSEHFPTHGLATSMLGSN